MLTINDFQVGDVLEITSRMRTGEEVHRVNVDAVNYNGNGGITYSGRTSGSGWFKPEEVRAKPFGFVVAVKEVGHIPPRPAHSDNGWMVRHPGYDLMY